jgi:hypothetical protein
VEQSVIAITQSHQFFSMIAAALLFQTAAFTNIKTPIQN